MAKVKLIDVAEKAGVSKSTVSQYLNGRFDYMSEKTKARVSAAITELDYVPNPIARSLKTAQTKTIGVIVRDLTGFYTSHVIRGIDDFCKANKYNVIIYNTDFDPEAEERSLAALYQLRVDGIIMSSSGKNAAMIESYEKKGMPIIQFQIEYSGNESNMIVSDYYQGAFDATEYLIDLGHRDIAFFTQDFKQVKSRNERYLGYVAAMEKHGISADESLIHYWHRETGFEQPPIDVLKQNKPPTAFFSQHLAITTELLSQFNQYGVSVPDDISLIGFDDLPMAEFFKVPVTVVDQNPHGIGMKAAEVLLESIKLKEVGTYRIEVPCSLTKRFSCKSL